MSITCRVTGYAYFKDVARGRLCGDSSGFLKVLSRAEAPTRHVLVGVQIIGAALEFHQYPVGFQVVR